MGFTDELEQAKKQFPAGLRQVLGNHDGSESYAIALINKEKLSGEALNEALALAGDNLHAKVCTRLIELGADPNSGQGVAINAAVWGRDHKLLKTLLDRGVVYSKHGNNNADLLSTMAHLNDLKGLKILLEAGVWPKDVKKDSGHSAEFTAGNNGNYEMSKLLLEHGGNASKVISGACCSYGTHKGGGPEGMPIEQRKRLIELGLEHDGDINAPSNKEPRRNSVYLARSGNLEVLEWASREKGLKLAADAVIEAADHGKLREVKWLVEQGMDPNVQKGEALLKAIGDGHGSRQPEVVAYLKPLRANAKPNDRDEWLDTMEMRAPKGLESESPYGMERHVFYGFVQDFGGRAGFVADDATAGVNQRAHRLAVLFGSDKAAAQFAAKWEEQIGNDRGALYAISEFQLPQSGKWDIAGWRAAAMKHGPSVLPLIEYAAQFTEMPDDKVFDAGKGMNLASGRQLRGSLDAALAALPTDVAARIQERSLGAERGRDSKVH